LADAQRRPLNARLRFERMPETSIDVIASALEGSAAVTLGEASSPDGAFTLLLCEIANIDAIRAAAPELLAALLADERIVVERIASHHAGNIARAHDDGFMIVFDSAHAGLRCAIELHRAFADTPGDDADGAPQLRIGLHTGTVIESGEELYGRNVLLAARIAGQAQGQEIVVSAKVKEYTESDPSFRFTALGERHFKGLHGEHELFSVDWGALQPSRE
jgi:class 3 adenylate cyclase